MLHAAAALLGPDVAQALGAADAGGILALLQVFDKVRLADEGAGGGDKLDAGVQDGLGRFGTAHAADQDEGDLDLLADGLGLVQVEGGHLLLAQAQPVVAGQLNGVGAQGLELTAEVEDVLGVGGLVLAAAVGVDLDEDGVVLADRLADGGETFAGEAEAVLGAAAVCIGALVGVGVQELAEQVAVGAVELDAVEAEFLGGLGSVHEVGLDLGHVLGGDLGGLHVVGGLQAAGGGQELAAGHVLFGHEDVHAGVHELEDQAAACLVHGVQHFLLAGPLFLGGKADLDAGGAGLGGDVAVSGDDGAGPGGGNVAVERDLFGGAGAVPVAEGVLGGGADDPVGQGHGADLAGREEVGRHGQSPLYHVKNSETFGRWSTANTSLYRTHAKNTRPFARFLSHRVKT